MFPDPTIEWLPYPSIVDKIKRPPFVQNCGQWRGTLILLVVECPPVTRAYGIEIDCEAYFVLDETLYSIAPHGKFGGSYDGGVYIKEAKRSCLLETFEGLDPFKREMRHFLFFGGDYCFETLGTTPPVIHAFASEEDADSWALGKASAAAAR